MNTASHILITGYEVRTEGEFAWVENWDGTRSMLPMSDVMQMIREGAAA